MQLVRKLRTWAREWKIVQMKLRHLLIQFNMRCIIMCFDHIHLTTLRDTFHLIDFTNVVQHTWRSCNTSCIAFEVHVVNLIEPDECHKKPYISFGESVSRKVPLFLEYGINLVECKSELINCKVVPVEHIGGHVF